MYSVKQITACKDIYYRKHRINGMAILEVNMNKSMIRKKIGYIIAGAFLSVIIISIFSINVYSQSLERRREYDKAQIDQMESGYIAAMKEVMDEYGCTYAGITMTKVYGKESSNYEVLIHHKNISYLDDCKQQELEKMLHHVVSDFPNAAFTFEFSY